MSNCTCSPSAPPQLPCASDAVHSFITRFLKRGGYAATVTAATSSAKCPFPKWSRTSCTSRGYRSLKPHSPDPPGLGCDLSRIMPARPPLASIIFGVLLVHLFRRDYDRWRERSASAAFISDWAKITFVTWFGTANHEVPRYLAVMRFSLEVLSEFNAFWPGGEGGGRVRAVGTVPKLII